MTSPRICSHIPNSVLDSISACEANAKDLTENKIDAIFGAYRDEKGRPWVMPFVLHLEKKLLQSATFNHEYVIFLGLQSFKELVPRLVFGENSPDLRSGRAFGVQTASGTGALRAGAELLVRHYNYTTFYTSAPTWENHELTFLYAGFSTSCQYRYWDPVKRGIDFEGMIEDLRQAPENSVIVLQVCAHNPTGCDLTKEQWTEVADIMQEKKLVPFFDAAYQGLASGDLEEDAWPVRYFVDRGFEMLVAQSFSKNMGLYGDRTGCLSVLLKEERRNETEYIKLMLTATVRALYLCPPRQGAEIVVRTLQDPALTKQWHDCLHKMVSRLKTVRQGLRERLEKLGTPGTWNHITNQTGMFLYTGLTSTQAKYLGREHHIHILPCGRTNMCAFNNNNLDRVAHAIHDSVTNATMCNGSL